LMKKSAVIFFETFLIKCYAEVKKVKSEKQFLNFIYS